uniref:Uncharacterized protein n=1 Tax=Panagrolaimus superbus TaxID=310955 RepID=A0A914YB68_9BILA
MDDDDDDELLLLNPLIIPTKPKRKYPKPAALAYKPMVNGATPQMLLNPNEYEYTPFKFDLNYAYFVNGKNNGKTELIKYVGGEKLIQCERVT